MDTATALEKRKVIAICRRLYGEPLRSLAGALIRGGVGAIEVTFDQSDTEAVRKSTEAMRMLSKEFSGDILVGAGTVLSPAQVDAAADAGALYIISPNTDGQVIERTKVLGLVSIPGAMTPTEIIAAHDAGADFVKLFPAGWLGLPYAKDIMAPISHVKLLATGGVSEKNFEDYLKLGFVGAGISSRLCDKKLLAEGDFDTIADRAAELAAIAARY